MENTMRIDVGNATIKVGTNLSTLGVAGVILLNNDIGFINGIIATIAGFVLVVVGVTIRDWRIE
tara:strand:+ start:2556 stop:2747 length:192 start_codon:yes stop_codon:yes gene_type:complete